MSTSPAEQGRLYTGLSEVLGHELAGDLVNAIPDISALATKEDLEKLRKEDLAELRAETKAGFEALQARFDRLWYTMIIVILATTGIAITLG